MAQELNEAQLNEISDAIIGGRKIEAIKRYREVTGASLKEAKDEIETITHSLTEQHSELLKQQSSGCASLIVIGLTLCMAILYLSKVGAA